MDKKILASMLIIAVVAGLVGAGVVSYFSDTETSKGNVFTAGTIDIAVDGDNPWTKTYSGCLADVKPCETRWINFTIKNVGTNPANIWKHLTVTKCDGGANVYPANAPVASSEPEYEEGLVSNVYVERCYLPPWIIYDLYVNDEPIIKEANELRLDDIECTWIFLGVLQPNTEMKVCQSYHLMTWKDSNVPMVTNWAQGDEMYFDIDLVARQLTAPSPEPGVLILENKDPTWWEPITGDGVEGKLKYNLAGHTFDYTFEASGLVANTEYSLIYYADPWPGNHPGALISTFTTDVSGSIASTSGNANIGFDLPQSTDKNYPAGAKIWLVPSSGYDATNHALIGWDPTAYLFGLNLIHYDYIP